MHIRVAEELPHPRGKPRLPALRHGLPVVDHLLEVVVVWWLVCVRFLVVFCAGGSGGAFWWFSGVLCAFWWFVVLVVARFLFVWCCLLAFVCGVFSFFFFCLWRLENKRREKEGKAQEQVRAHNF